MNILKWLNSKLILLFMMMLVPLLVACKVPLSAPVHETVEAGALYA